MDFFPPLIILRFLCSWVSLWYQQNYTEQRHLLPTAWVEVVHSRPKGVSVNASDEVWELLPVLILPWGRPRAKQVHRLGTESRRVTGSVELPAELPQNSNHKLPQCLGENNRKDKSIIWPLAFFNVCPHIKTITEDIEAKHMPDAPI